MQFFTKSAMTIFILSVTLCVNNAIASTLTIGKTSIESCYESAHMENRSNAAIATCNFALLNANMPMVDYAATLVNRGIIHSYRNDLESALKDYNRALEVFPENAEAYANRGVAYIRMQRHDEALSDFNKALTLTPNIPAYVYYNRASVFEALGQTKNAYKDLKKASALDPEWVLPRKELQRYHVINR